jgi:hypothetical protein
MKSCAPENQLDVIYYYALTSRFLTRKNKSESDLVKNLRGGSIRPKLAQRYFAIPHALGIV